MAPLPRPTPAAGYTLAVAAVALCAIARGLLMPWTGGESPVLLFTVAVLVAGSYGGLGPGVLATVLSVAVAGIFQPVPVPSMVLFLLVGLSVTALCSRLRHAARVLEQAQAERQALLEREQTLRAEAEGASRLKDDFLATLSHELRTPLNAILGWTGILRRQPGDAELRRGLDVIERSVRLQTEIVDDLLDMSRIVSGNLQVERLPVNALALLRGAVESAAPPAAEKGVSLDLAAELAPGDCIPGDAWRLQQVVDNLLGNAVKFTPSGGRVTLLARTEGERVVVQVQDTGCGIAPDFLPHVFDRFRQADSRSTRRHGGLGLGLALVRHLVELHDGRIAAQSPGVGRGATFTVTLPRQAGSPLPEACVGAAAAGADVAGLRVLVVDDEADAREVVARLLEGCGATVVTASSAAGALQALRGGAFDVLLSDLGMPDQDGYDLIRAVRALPDAEGGAVPAAAFTAFTTDEDRDRALEAGFQYHLAKPVDAAELLAVTAGLGGRS